MTTFFDFNVEPELQDSIARLGFSAPTPIQEAAIPVGLSGQDILASAQTGTGKTLAFGVPLTQHLLKNSNRSALVLAPTRELAKQILDVLTKLSNLNTALIIGGESYQKQRRQLQKRPRIIVGTPGRIIDFVEQKELNLSSVGFLVLDETDRMLDMGFSKPLEFIISKTPKKRQTLLFSATLPDNITSLAGKYLHDHERIELAGECKPVESVSHVVLKVSQHDKYPELVRELEEREGSVIVFVKTKYGTERLAKKLAQSEVRAEAIHGDLRQAKRDRVVSGLRGQKFRVLVATDIVARGLDIPHVRHVINYDLPQASEDYVHRLGRTGRAGETGDAVSFVTPEDSAKWRTIERSYYGKTEEPRAKKPGRKGRRRRSRR